jgi:hypothetical protein
MFDIHNISGFGSGMQVLVLIDHDIMTCRPIARQRLRNEQLDNGP